MDIAEIHAHCRTLEAPQTAIVQPGSWTPARCEFWRMLETVELRQRLERWVHAERESGVYGGLELPPLRRRAA